MRSWDLCAGTREKEGPEGGCFVAMRSVAAACLLYSAGKKAKPVLIETGGPMNSCRKELLQKLASRLKQEVPSGMFEVPLPNGELMRLPSMPFED